MAKYAESRALADAAGSGAARTPLTVAALLANGY